MTSRALAVGGTTRPTVTNVSSADLMVRRSQYVWNPDISPEHIPSGHSPPHIPPPAQFALFFTRCKTFYHRHPPMYNIKRSTIDMY